MSRIYLSPPEITAEDYRSLHAVLDSNWVAPAGPHLEEFETSVCELIGARHALALSSGTAALHLALRAIGVGPGDAVICPSFTFAASANPICYLGAEPVFVDSEPRTWNMDPELLAEALEARDDVKAVIVVHLYGQCAEMDSILELCRQHDVPLIEDAAEALGASYHGRPAGSMGDLAFFSFNGNKIVTTSGGGMLVSNHGEWIERARYFASQAREAVTHYEHKEVGYNYRMSNLLAGLGSSQLADLGRRIHLRRAHSEAYERAFRSIDGISMMPMAEPEACNYWLSCLTLDFPQNTRDRLIEVLEENDIEARPLWKPMHLQPVYSEAPIFGGSVCADLFERGVCLPSGTGMHADERDRVIALVQEVCGPS